MTESYSEMVIVFPALPVLLLLPPALETKLKFLFKTIQFFSNTRDELASNNKTVYSHILYVEVAITKLNLCFISVIFKQISFREKKTRGI